MGLRWGGAAEDDRRLADAALRVPGTGAPWRDLPPDYGGWKSKHRRFRRRRDKRVWERPFGELAGEPDPGWPLAGATHVKARHDGTGATGGSEGVGRTKGVRHEDTPGRGCAWYASWIPCRAWYLGGSRVCCRADLGFDADALLPRRACDTDEALAEASGRGTGAHVPPKSDRRERRAIGPHPYEQRHLVENAFERVRRWRGLATRYRERLSSLVAAVQIRCALLWLHIL